MLGDDDDDEIFEIWPENARAVEMFLACRTQWRLGPMGGVLGLDYQGVDAGLRMMGIEDRRTMFEDLQTMEAAALPVLNEAKP